MSSDTQSTALVPLKPINLETLDGEQLDQKRNSFVFDANSLTQRVQAMFANLDGLQKERAMKAVLCGLYLAEIRAKTAHGEFVPWMHANFPSSVRKAQYYIQLAGKFAKSSKLLLPELIATEQITLQLTTDDATAKTALAKLEKFVGSTGLTDLLRKHGIVKRGGHQTKTPALPAPADTTPAIVDEAKEAQEATSAVFTQATGILKTVETYLTGETFWSSITVDSASMIEAKIKALEARFHERFLQYRHENEV